MEPLRYWFTDHYHGDCIATLTSYKTTRNHKTVVRYRWITSKPTSAGMASFTSVMSAVNYANNHRHMLPVAPGTPLGAI